MNRSPYDVQRTRILKACQGAGNPTRQADLVQRLLVRGTLGLSTTVRIRGYNGVRARTYVVTPRVRS